jgi:hypothetical protein
VRPYWSLPYCSKTSGFLADQNARSDRKMILATSTALQFHHLVSGARHHCSSRYQIEDRLFWEKLEPQGSL